MDDDLFERIETSGAQAERRLSALSYTVFDTETTGLDAEGGDRIVEIGDFASILMVFWIK